MLGLVELHAIPCEPHRSLENDSPELLSDDPGLLEQLPARSLLVALSRFETAAWTDQQARTSPDAGTPLNSKTLP